MGDVVVKVADIEWLLSILVLIFGVVRIIREVKKPNEELRKKVELHDRYLEQDHEYLHELNSRNKILYKSLLALIEHGIDGNSIDKLKKIRTELQEFIIDEKGE